MSCSSCGDRGARRVPPDALLHRILSRSAVLLAEGVRCEARRRATEKWAKTPPPTMFVLRMMELEQEPLARSEGAELSAPARLP